MGGANIELNSLIWGQESQSLISIKILEIQTFSWNAFFDREVFLA